MMSAFRPDPNVELMDSQGLDLLLASSSTYWVHVVWFGLRDLVVVWGDEMMG